MRRTHPINYTGFTLIELLVVFSIIAIVSTVTLASFTDFNKSSAIKQASAELVSFMSDAKSRAVSQIKPSSCTGTLDGYVVDVCLSVSGSCSAVDTYQMSIMCSGTKTLITSTKKTLPAKIHFINAGTTSTSYFFKVLNGGVSGSGSVVLSGYNLTSTVTVTNTGSITYH